MLSEMTTGHLLPWLSMGNVMITCMGVPGNDGVEVPVHVVGFYIQSVLKLRGCLLGGQVGIVSFFQGVVKEVLRVRGGGIELEPC